MTKRTAEILTEAKVKYAAPGKYTDAKDLEGGVLFLRVSPKGKKTWSIDYRHPTTKKRNTQKLGVYPELTVKNARAEAKATLAKLEGKLFTKEVEKLVDENKKPETFADLFTNFMVNHCAKFNKPGQQKYNQEQYDRHLKHQIGHLKIEDVTRPVLVKLLDWKFETHRNTARKMYAIISKVFVVAVDEGHAVYNPAAGLGKRYPENPPKQRILSDGELVEIFKAIDQGACSKMYKVAFATFLYSMQRRVNVRAMKWADLDLEKQVWMIDAEEMKNGQPHLVPLSASLTALLKQWKEIQKDVDSGFVFPAARKSKTGHIDTVKSQIGNIQEETGFNGWSTHDIRRTTRTNMSRFRVDRDIAEALMAHANGKKMVQVYDLWEHLEEKMDAMERVAKLYDSLIGDYLKLD